MTFLRFTNGHMNPTIVLNGLTPRLLVWWLQIVVRGEFKGSIRVVIECLGVKHMAKRQN